MGTIHWMAPEMIRDETFSFASDVYALGIIFWEILACSIPYENFSRKRALEDAVLAGERPPINVDWPSEAQDLMMHCWANEPSHRLKASEVVEILGSSDSENAKALFPAKAVKDHGRKSCSN